jgi:hypothetical protein
MRQLPLAARLYSVAVILVAVVLVLRAVQQMPAGAWLSVAVLAILVVISETATLSLNNGALAGLGISTTMPVVMASYLIVGPWGAAIVGLAVIAEATSFQMIKRLFNAAQMSISGLVAGQVYLLLGGDAPLTRESFPKAIVLVLVANFVFEIVNASLVLGIVSLAERVAPYRVWVGMMRELVLPYFVYSTFGLLLAVVWSSGVGGFAAVLVLAPLLVARWVFAQFAAKREAYEATMRSLIQAVETKDTYTRGHSERVARGSVLVGRGIGMREDRIASLRYAGMLHDVGKLGVPTAVLQKSGRLTDDEFSAIQLHPVRGREITRDLEFLGEAVEGIYHHHERIDGRGYPLGLSGSEIPEFARVIAVADAFDSMTTTRSYRGARSHEDAIAELRRCKGSQFDPVMVEAMAAGLATEGWDVSDTVPADLLGPTASAPSFGRDDDDPTAVSALGLGGPLGAAPVPDTPPGPAPDRGGGR